MDSRFFWRAVTAALALTCLGGALWLAVHHPLSPVLVLALLCVWSCLAVWQPKAWLWLVPACLPWLNFSPWTGWVVFEEFDILLLATLASGYARLAWLGCRPSCAVLPVVARVLLAVSLGAGALAFWRGVGDAGGFDWNWFAGYGDALNSWRVFKSLLFALLFVPLLGAASVPALARRQAIFSLGVLSGLSVVVLAVVWERAAFAGVFDFSVHYRTVALFWEMHVGGAALDVYLALTAPFVIWALVTVRRRGLWLLAAALAVLLVYAGLTTFSRGVYLAIGLPTTVLVSWLGWQKFAPAQAGVPQRWRARASAALVVVVVLEVLVVLIGGTFMSERLGRAEQDLSSRMEHWRSGVALLHGPADWLFGKGLGRLPANYAAQVPDGGFSGDVRWHPGRVSDGQQNAYVVLSGPARNPDLGGAYALTQRVQTPVHGPFRVTIKVRVQSATRLEMYLCERHLLYDRSCLAAWGTVKPGSTADGWQTLTWPLRGETFDPDPWYGARLKMFSIAVSDAGAEAELAKLQLIAPNGKDVLANGDFAGALAHWLGAAQSYFEPWHLDNLMLEVLVERGLLGLLTLLALLGYAIYQLLWRGARQQPLSPYIAAALFAVVLVGLVSSVMDVPRVAFLFYLLLFMSLRRAQFSNSSMVDWGVSIRDS